MRTYFRDDNVYITVMHYAGQNKECQGRKLNVQLAFKPCYKHDDTADAAERSLGAGMQLPRSMLLRMKRSMPVRRALKNWRVPDPIDYASYMGKGVNLVKLNRLAVAANIRFVESDAS